VRKKVKRLLLIAVVLALFSAASFLMIGCNPGPSPAEEVYEEQ